MPAMTDPQRAEAILLDVASLAVKLRGLNDAYLDDGMLLASMATRDAIEGLDAILISDYLRTERRKGDLICDALDAHSAANAARLLASECGEAS